MRRRNCPGTRVKGDQQGTRRQRCALQQKVLRFIKADPAPAVFGHASALVFKMFRADGDGPRKAADVMVHEYRKAVCAHGASLNCLEGIRGNGLVCGGDGALPVVLPRRRGMGKTPYTVRCASEHRACRFFMMKRARFQPCSDTEKGAAPSSEPPPGRVDQRLPLRLRCLVPVFDAHWCSCVRNCIGLIGLSGSRTSKCR